MTDINILGSDCDGIDIYEFDILNAIWANDIPIEELEDSDPRMYCAVVGDDGNAYAISINDFENEKLIREREHIPSSEEVPRVIKPITAMQNYELSYMGSYDSNTEELKCILNKLLKDSPLTKMIDDVNDEIIKIRKSGQSVKNISDGYHTFEDYINMRNRYFMALCETYYDLSWKSRNHFDEKNDPMFGGDFIAGINTPTGVIAQHIKLKYWDELNVKEVDNAPQYDGYTEEDVEHRVKSLTKIMKPADSKK